MTISDGRQVGDIRGDHRARYWFAGGLAKAAGAVSCLDVGCGTGYGARILELETGGLVIGLDRSVIALQTARSEQLNVAASRCIFVQAEVPPFPDLGDSPFDFATAFEIVEHMADPAAMLRALAEIARDLVVSTPNEAVVPFGKGSHPEHKRHYLLRGLLELLNQTGWDLVGVFGQRDKEPGHVERAIDLRMGTRETLARTLVLHARSRLL